jgi:hypothetical protein
MILNDFEVCVDRTLADLKTVRCFASAVARCLSSLDVEVDDVDRTLADLKTARLFAWWTAVARCLS